MKLILEKLKEIENTTINSIDLDKKEMELMLLLSQKGMVLDNSDEEVSYIIENNKIVGCIFKLKEEKKIVVDFN